MLYLDPHVSEDGGSPRRRLTRAQFEIAAEQAAYMNKTLRDWRRRDLPPDPPPPLNVLRQCWLPRELARQWIEKHGYRWPAHFEIRGPPTPLTSMAKPADAPPTQSTNPAEAKHNEAMAANGQSNKKRRGGRHPGSGQRDDEEALRGMLALLAAGKAASVYAAAKIVVSEGKPAHSAEAEIHRLRKKFSGRWGNEPPPGKIWADVGHE
ncbi:MAG TPA: hypothetical protein VJ770_29515 [Stellaceae bacterium]|nr:hypothetical protein [Stellaceae bacterium]